MAIFRKKVICLMIRRLRDFKDICPIFLVTLIVELIVIDSFSNCLLSSSVVMPSFNMLAPFLFRHVSHKMTFFVDVIRVPVPQN